MKTIIAIGLAAVALAGCGSGNSSSSSSNASGSSSASPTLYTFSKDTSGMSNCSGACAKNWPPAASAPGLDSGKITKIKRSDGSMQVALGGRPLYRYVGDKKPGDANGNGLTVFGGTWKAVGAAAASKPPSRGSGY